MERFDGLQDSHPSHKEEEVSLILKPSSHLGYLQSLRLCSYATARGYVVLLWGYCVVIVVGLLFCGCCCYGIVVVWSLLWGCCCVGVVVVAVIVLVVLHRIKSSF